MSRVQQQIAELIPLYLQFLEQKETQLERELARLQRGRRNHPIDATEADTVPSIDSAETAT